MERYIEINQPMCAWAFAPCTKGTPCTMKVSKLDYHTHCSDMKRIRECEFKGNFLTQEEFNQKKYIKLCRE